MAREEEPSLASPAGEPDRAARGVGEAGAPPADRVGGALHRPGVAEELLAGGGEDEAVGQPVEEPGTDRVLERLDPAGDGGVAHLQPACRRRQPALGRQREEYPEIIPIRAHRPVSHS